MAQLRQDYEAFRSRNAEMLVVVPNGPRMIGKHMRECAPPYAILSDKGGRVAVQYGICVRRTILPALSCVLTPTLFLIDRAGTVRYTNYTRSYVREPDDREPLAVLDDMAGEGLPTG